MNQSYRAKLSTKHAVVAAVCCLVLLVAAVVTAYLTQTDFGRVSVSNVTYENWNGIRVRAKLFAPNSNPGETFPGIVYVHGYQNNRETGDAYCIELSRRGFVVLNIDALGRGNSGNPGKIDDSDFDESYGASRSLQYLKDLPEVDPNSVGLIGHSLGAEMVYGVALGDSSVRALVITGFAYREDASFTAPKNMLMIMGKYDEFRERMTHTDDIELEWMSTPQTKNAINHPAPKLATTYGDFSDGTARRVFVPEITHVMESHDRNSIAESLEWMRASLGPAPRFWSDPFRQIWPVKEIATLVALVTGLWILIPLSVVLIKMPPFSSLVRKRRFIYTCPPSTYWKSTVVNGVVMCLYLPFILILFAVHLYIVPIDGAFPFMMVNGIVWWFLLVNVFGLIMFRVWRKREGGTVSLVDLGISAVDDEFSVPWREFGKTALYSAVLFLIVFSIQGLLERLFIVEYRFVFPFASDLTWNRALQFLKYFPFLLFGFILLGISIHGRLRRDEKSTELKTLFSWSTTNILSLTVPLVVFLAVQYIPLFGFGVIPMVGPSGMFIPFILDLFHILGVLMIVLPISTWLYQLTSNIYAGALLSAAIVTWMFVSSQVIAPIPV